MSLISDPVLAQVFNSCAHPDLPSSVVAGAHWMIHLLLAARSWSTIGAFAEIRRHGEHRFRAPIDAGWAITFEWDGAASRVCNARLEAC
jgi:hypothetical protein